MGFFFNIVLAVGVALANYFLFGRKKKQKRPEIEDLELPTSLAGRTIPKLYGTMAISGLNIIAKADRRSNTFKIKV